MKRIHISLFFFKKVKSKRFSDLIIFWGLIFEENRSNLGLFTIRKINTLPPVIKKCIVKEGVACIMVISLKVLRERSIK